MIALKMQQNNKFYRDFLNKASHFIWTESKSVDRNGNFQWLNYDRNVNLQELNDNETYVSSHIWREQTQYTGTIPKWQEAQ